MEAQRRERPLAAEPEGAYVDVVRPRFRRGTGR
jgi:hypothetical protein